ncbi:ricin-type beta-trefoil lectin domain protein [Streptomyces brasiliensis]|uniref:Hydrolase n=1 Tax=Streptomyces brasiliensis TaxID=1954 RepID=A0A917K362_9ACTN|nr:ricin-type beta-trefoil lectin domain protein [Streptomyces brasiliensis]GGI97173.1 hydrolase [Streptomyces brasiliensis]
MDDAGLSNSPGPAPPFGITDEQLSTELKKWTGSTPALHPVGELLDRHWEAAFAYARLCTDGTRAAGMLTTAAFTRLFGESLRQTGPTSAWRPHLLVTVRRIAAEWDNDGRQELLNPALRSGTGERAAARLLPPTDRRLLSRAFQRLPQSSRAVLWHTEVEAEPASVPAALLGLDPEGAGIELRRARARLREECLQVHRELAAEDECLRYVRMLDVTFRRGGAHVDPDLRQHLNRCRHCRHTADQLNRFNAGLGLALAEAVLGWGAQAYVESRAGLAAAGPEPEPAATALPAPIGGEAFAAPTVPRPPAGGRRSAHRAARRVRRRNLALAVATVSGLVVLPLVLWAVFASGDGAAPAHDGKATATPGSGPSKSGPSWAGADASAQGVLRGRLRNLAAGLCVDLVGDKAVKGAETELAKCSSHASQQWTYEPDGLLRSTAAPDLCLDSRLGYSVRLAPCTRTSAKSGKNVRYDFTLQGALVPRSDQDLALTPAATDGAGALVLKNRTGTTVQRWVVDTSKPDLQMEVVNWGSEHPVPARPTPMATRPPSPTPSATASTPAPSPSSSGPADFCDQYPDYCHGDGRSGGWGDGGGGDGRRGR